jgi:putative ABC transport system permease protein
MHVLIEAVRATLIAIRTHRFRAFLTSLGIIVGVASIIALVAIIHGFSGTITHLFEGLGSNNLAISSFTSNAKQQRGQFARIRPEDVTTVRERVEGLSALTPILFSPDNVGAMSAVRHGSDTTYARVLGTTYEYKRVAQLNIAYGRSLADSDNRTRRSVAVIGEDVRKKLALPADPVGQYIEIGGEWIRVVGLTEPKGDLFGFNQDAFVLLPYETMRSIIGRQKTSDIQMILRVTDLARSGAISDKVRHLLRRSHGLSPKEEDDFKIQTPEQLLSGFSSLVRAVTSITIGLISVSLLVGGIGIMNIMLVSVNERTREIGICKALGAKRHHILLQFLLEALILCTLGGLVGIAAGYGVGALVSTVFGFPEARIPLWAVTLSMGFAAAVGIVFGVLPAAKAARMDPIEALRHE